MKTVTCTLENAAETINGVSFQRQKDGSVMATLDDGVAEQFEGIPGYRVVDANRQGQQQKQPQQPQQSQQTEEK